MALLKRIELGPILWTLRRQGRRLAWQGQLGLALIVASLMAAAFLVFPMRAESLAIRESAQALRENVAVRNDMRQQADPAAQLGEFYKAFPGPDFLADSLQKIYAAALDNEIILNQGDYTLAEPESGLLQRYEVALPLRAKYAQVRNFLAQILGEKKNIALLGLSLTRGSATDGDMDVQLRFAVYVKDMP